ncbi:MAG TPA: hypothetical protein PLD88_10110, partial [Candidatus Berkiella sp.]|nr:hypothetical protein [Candidatus Berkiella sp.]
MYYAYCSHFYGNITPTRLWLSLNDINFGIKIEKIYEKVKKAIDRGETNKIVGYMFDFKTEVEQYSGKKIDIDKHLDEVQRQAKANGQKIEDEQPEVYETQGD